MSDTNSSFYNTEQTDEVYTPVTPEGPDAFTSPSGTNSSFYEEGIAYAGADPVAAEDAAIRAKASADAALVSEQNAASSATDAATSAANASASETNAAASAAAAATSEGSASTSATAAASSASAAATSETHAATSETNAAAYASTATTQAGVASGYAVSAGTYAGQAHTSEVNAATSETNAASSATAAAASASSAAGAVQAAAGTATPLMDGTAAVGTGTKWSREDHKHPTDTSRAPLASPGFTGTPTAPTPTVGDNSTKLATTAFVANAAGSAGVGSFSVNRNNVDQTGMTAGAENKIRFNNEVSDANGWFDSTTNYRYTPQVAGTYFFALQAAAIKGTSGETPQAILYKNGTKVTGGLYLAQSSGAGNFNSTAMIGIYMNGTTDYVEAYIYLPATITTITGSTLNTFFSGFRQGA